MHHFFYTLRHYIFALCCISMNAPVEAAFYKFENFEGLTDGTSLTNQISGLTFTDATVLTAGVSLNEIDFPPVSGQNVLAGLNGSIEIVFGDVVGAVSGYFTYTNPLTLSVFDVNDIFLASVLSQDTSNLGSNEFIRIEAVGMKSIRIESNDPFTLDDLTVPEPSTCLLLAIGVMGFRLPRHTHKHR